MSVSSVGSANAFAFKWPLQADSASSSSNANPTDALQSLFDAITGGSGGSSDPLIAALGQDSGSGNSGSSGGSCGMPQFSADTMSALLSMQSGQGNPAGDIAKDVIAKFDTDGDGQVSQSEFEQAIGSGADQSGVDALFNKLDTNGDGSVSQDELQTAMQKAHGGGHHHHHVEASSDTGQQQGSDPLQALLSGASADGTSSQTSANADGSSTTTITYSDGTKLEMTTPAASSDGSSNSGSGNPNAFNLGNLLKMMVNLQAQLAPSTTNVSV
jgi:hypothetical protein